MSHEHNHSEAKGPVGIHYPGPPNHKKRMKKKLYERELKTLQVELAKLQSWTRAKNERICILFEGRDAAGKGGAIKRITEPMNPRIARVAALAAPTERERGQWYFQRYIQHLPSAGEIVLFDRSWYNRAGVERVMGFATDEQVERFLNQVSSLEKTLVDDGIRLVKYWFSVSSEQQEIRFSERIANPEKRWKLSPMDLESRARWDDYSDAKDEMLSRTSTDHAPWFVVEANDKRRARLNCIHHLLATMPYKDHIQEAFTLPPRKAHNQRDRPDYSTQLIVPRIY